MRSWCFDSVATEVDGVTTYDREYGSAEFREVMRKLVGDGVYANPANNMQVTAGGGLTVSVLPGYCWIHGALGIVDEAESLAVDATTKGRTDLIVARFDLSLAARDIHLAVVKGTEGSADAPALTRNDSVYDICLAKVRVSAGATAVALSDITDTRYDANLCGIVTGVIDQIDATDLFAQYGDVFNVFMQQLESVLSGDVAGNLLVLINNHIDDTNNPHAVTKAQLGIGADVIPEEDLYLHDSPSATMALTRICKDQNVLPTAYIVSVRVAKSSGVIENNSGAAILFKDSTVSIVVDGITVNARYNDIGGNFGYGFRAWCSDSYNHSITQVYVSAVGIYL